MPRSAPVPAALALRLAAMIVAAALLAPPAPARGSEAPRCTTCGETIQGEYVVYSELGWTVCARCAAAPKCVGCGLPCAGRNEGQDGWCARCVQRADRCAACGRPILDRYWTVRGVAGKFCSRCRSEAPSCSSCGAPARDGRSIDGRVFCRHCRPRLVDDPAVCAALYRDVADRAREVLGLTLARLPELVVDRQEALRADAAVPAGAHAADVCGLFVRDDQGGTTIHLLSNLTETRATAVLAHELAHAWQSEHCPDDQGLRLREGFAEWVAWKLLAGREGADAERAVIEGRTDEYGVGFRFFADAEARHGVEHVLWYARSARNGS